MPTSGRAACSAGQATQPSRTRSTEHTSSPRTEKAKSAQIIHPPRKESAAASQAAMAQRPGGLKSRAYSAPMVPKNRTDASETNTMGLPPLETGDEDEIAGDPFFQRYNFPQAGGPVEASSSSIDSSSDTEGPLSPTHVKGRQSGLPETLPSPRSPVLSVAVRYYYSLALNLRLLVQPTDSSCECSLGLVTPYLLCRT